jgi:hypothetical protein
MNRKYSDNPAPDLSFAVLAALLAHGKRPRKQMTEAEIKEAEAEEDRQNWNAQVESKRMDKLERKRKKRMMFGSKP